MRANTRLRATEPDVNATLPHFVDGNGRFAAMFPGSSKLSGGVRANCGITSGPGKAVLHQ